MLDRLSVPFVCVTERQSRRCGCLVASAKRAQTHAHNNKTRNRVCIHEQRADGNGGMFLLPIATLHDSCHHPPFLDSHDNDND